MLEWQLFVWIDRYFRSTPLDVVECDAIVAFDSSPWSRRFLWFLWTTAESVVGIMYYSFEWSGTHLIVFIHTRTRSRARR